MTNLCGPYTGCACGAVDFPSLIPRRQVDRRLCGVLFLRVDVRQSDRSADRLNTKNPRRKFSAGGTRISVQQSQKPLPFPRYAHQDGSIPEPRIQRPHSESAGCRLERNQVVLGIYMICEIAESRYFI